MAEEQKTKETEKKKDNEKQIVEKPAKAVKESLSDKEKPQKKTEPEAKIDDPFRTLKFVLMTEKAVQVIEKQNKLVFIVDRGANKGDIKAAVEAAFTSPISAVQTMIDRDGRKRAFVKFRNAGAAGDIAIRLGII